MLARIAAPPFPRTTARAATLSTAESRASSSPLPTPPRTRTTWSRRRMLSASRWRGSKRGATDQPWLPAPILVRIADPLIGAAIAHLFNYVWPRWEPPRIASRLQAQLATFAALALRADRAH